MYLADANKTRLAAPPRGMREHCADGVTERSLILRQQPYIGRPELSVTHHS